METKNNSGAIFKNEFKTGDTHPDYKGKICIEGVVKEIALWINKPDGKKPYFGVKISDVYVKPENTTSVEGDSDIPQPEQDLPF